MEIKNKSKLREALKSRHSTQEQYTKVMKALETTGTEYCYISERVLTTILSIDSIKNKYQIILDLENKR